ncbi:hypothetical protein HC891_11755, partial [Candidatus Gracilibacteria bacterium]|nr:hypothetical protein [Candidatus Gracilibacteria bacterium]
MSQPFVFFSDLALALRSFGLPDLPWALPGSPLFCIGVDGALIEGSALRLDALREQSSAGRNELIAELYHDSLDLAVDFHVAQYTGTALAETWLTIRNTGTQPRCITRIDSLALDLPPDRYQLRSFTGSWGLEFALDQQELSGTTILESRAGRSSKGHHPWFALARTDGVEVRSQESGVRRPDASDHSEGSGASILAGAVAWSGNWVVRFEPHAGGVRLSGGLHDWESLRTSVWCPDRRHRPFVVALAPGDESEQVS